MQFSNKNLKLPTHPAVELVVCFYPRVPPILIDFCTYVISHNQGLRQSDCVSEMLSDILNINQNSFFSCLAAGIKKKLSASLTFCIRNLTVTVAGGAKIKIFDFIPDYKFYDIKTTTQMESGPVHCSVSRLLPTPPLAVNQCINLWWLN